MLNWCLLVVNSNPFKSFYTTILGDSLVSWLTLLTHQPRAGEVPIHYNLSACPFQVEILSTVIYMFIPLYGTIHYQTAKFLWCDSFVFFQVKVRSFYLLEKNLLFHNYRITFRLISSHSLHYQSTICSSTNQSYTWASYSPWKRRVISWLLTILLSSFIDLGLVSWILPCVDTSDKLTVAH